MITRRAALILAMGLSVAASPVYAGGGGGGTKRSGKITFINNSTTEVGVTPYGTSPLILAALTAKSLTQFIAAGGKVLNPGASGYFSVQAGTYTVGAADVSSATGTTNATVITPITQSVTVSQGQYVTVKILNAPAGSGNTIEF